MLRPQTQHFVGRAVKGVNLEMRNSHHVATSDAAARSVAWLRSSKNQSTWLCDTRSHLSLVSGGRPPCPCAEVPAVMGHTPKGSTLGACR